METCTQRRRRITIDKILKMEDEGFDSEKIAGKLNQQGIKTLRGSDWNTLKVYAFRYNWIRTSRRNERVQIPLAPVAQNTNGNVEIMMTALNASLANEKKLKAIAAILNN